MRTSAFLAGRLIVFAIGKHDEDRRFSPGFDEAVVGKQDQRITLAEADFAQVFVRVTTAPDFFYFGTVVTFEVEFTYSFVDTRETCAEDGFHRMKRRVVLFFFGREIIWTIGRQQLAGKQNR